MNLKNQSYFGMAVSISLILIYLPACETVGDTAQQTDLQSRSKSDRILDPAGRKWDLIINDGLHDPEGIGAYGLEQPEKELTTMPAGEGGNQVNWVDALAEGYIYPKASIFPNQKEKALDLDVLLKETGEMPMITFPHIKHTLWLGCENCHDHLFERKAGATPNLNMYAVLSGKKCGLCHGAVAFPPNDCIRCHNTPRSSETVQHKKLR